MKGPLFRTAATNPHPREREGGSVTSCGFKRHVPLSHAVVENGEKRREENDDDEQEEREETRLGLTRQGRAFVPEKGTSSPPALVYSPSSSTIFGERIFWCFRWGSFLTVPRRLLWLRDVSLRPPHRQQDSKAGSLSNVLCCSS